MSPERHDQGAPPASPGGGSIAPFDMLLSGSSPIATVRDLVAAGFLNKDCQAGSSAVEGARLQGYAEPIAGGTTRTQAAPTPECPAEQQGVYVGMAASPRPGDEAEQRTGQCTAAVRSGYKRQLASAPAPLVGPGRRCQALGAVLCGTGVLPPTDAIECAMQAVSCTGVQQAAACHFEPYDSSLAQFAQPCQAFTRGTMVPCGNTMQDKDATENGLVLQADPNGRDHVELKTIRDLYGAQVAVHLSRDAFVFAETEPAAPMRSSLQYEAPTPPPTAAHGLVELEMSGYSSCQGGTPQRPYSSRSVFSHTGLMHATEHHAPSNATTCHPSGTAEGSHGIGAYGGSAQPQNNRNCSIGHGASREADARKAMAAWSEWLAEGNHSGTAKCGQPSRQHAIRKKLGCRISSIIGPEAAVLARHVGVSRVRPNAVHSAQNGSGGLVGSKVGGGRSLHTSVCAKANEGLMVARVPDVGGSTADSKGDGAMVPESSRRGGIQTRRTTTPQTDSAEKHSRTTGQDALVGSVYRARVHEHAVREQETILMRPQDTIALRCNL